MKELFIDIIIGEKSILELDKVEFSFNLRSKKTVKVGKLFINAARGKYNIGEIDKDELDNLIFEYSKLLATNKTIRDYIHAPFDDETTLGLINHTIVVFMDRYIQNKDQLVQNRGIQKIMNRQIQVKGFVEPSLLALVTASIGLLFMANLYLYM